MHQLRDDNVIKCVSREDSDIWILYESFILIIVGLKDIHISTSCSFIDIEYDHKPQESEVIIIHILHCGSEII